MSKIIVTGDITKDMLNLRVKKEKGERKYTWDYEGYAISCLNGGASLLAEMIKNGDSGNEIDLIAYDQTKIENDKNFEIVENMVYLKNYDSFDDKIQRTTRIKSFGFKRPGNLNAIKIPQEYKPGLDNNVNLTVIHDSGSGFRYDKKNWHDDLFKSQIIIHKMGRPLVKGDLWKKTKKCKEKLVVVIDVNDLREKGLRISRSLSWERTAYDLLKEMEKIRNDEKCSDLKDLIDCKNLIVRFGTDGAIHYQNEGKGIKYHLYFDPYVFEGHHENTYPGHMYGLFIAFVAGLALEIQKNNNPHDISNEIESGIKKGLVMSRQLYKIGFKIENDKVNYPFNEMFNEIKPEDIIKVEVKSDSRWKILNYPNKEKTYEVASKIVKNGNFSILKSPIAVFGKLHTADRSEIENYHTMKNLIEEYLKKDSHIPLSIAVFGPPGSGKSFGISEIANTLSDDIKKLEFNLSQFESPDDLANAFHMVQSTSLGGRVPLVFFDEFDCKKGDVENAWLKYFLSPMNDGLFKHGESTHPIGKSIFVFAGGTSESFQQFNPGKNDKGPDFMSRLRGYVNIIGINKPDKKSCNEDNLYMIRRAMNLRSMLEEMAGNIFEKDKNGNNTIANVDGSVLNAFIKVPEYKHGFRSMKAIVEMSILSKNEKFLRSALPPSQQLELHVNADKFKNCLNEFKECPKTR